MKKWWKSKTVWYNVAMTLLAIANELAPVVDLMDGERAEVIRAYLVIASSVGNIILRTVTSTKVTL